MPAPVSHLLVSLYANATKFAMHAEDEHYKKNHERGGWQARRPPSKRILQQNIDLPLKFVFWFEPCKIVVLPLCMALWAPSRCTAAKSTVKTNLLTSFRGFSKFDFWLIWSGWCQRVLAARAILQVPSLHLQHQLRPQILFVAKNNGLLPWQFAGDSNSLWARVSRCHHQRCRTSSCLWNGVAPHRGGAATIADVSATLCHYDCVPEGW